MPEPAFRPRPAAGWAARMADTERRISLAPCPKVPTSRASSASSASATRGAGAGPPRASATRRRPRVARGGRAPRPLARSAAIDEASTPILAHVERGARITVHGDYDVDGVCSTAILVRALRDLGADVDWFLPSRREDGYGLAARDRRAAGRARDAAAGHRGLRDHRRRRGRGGARGGHGRRRHRPPPAARRRHAARRADRAPARLRLPVPRPLRRRRRATSSRPALLEAAAEDPAGADGTSTSSRWRRSPTACRSRREPPPRPRGPAALGATAQARACARSCASRSRPDALDARAIGFRLAPGSTPPAGCTAPTPASSCSSPRTRRAPRRRRRARPGNVERRHTETRILFEAEAQVAELATAPAYVLAGEGWHPGVIGIVASRIAERHHRPTVLIALDGERQGTGSGRSIPGFDLLGGLDACADTCSPRRPPRRGRLEIARDARRRLPRAFETHAAAALTPEDLSRRARRRGRRRRRARHRPRRGARTPRAVRDRQPGVTLLVPGRAPYRPAADGRGRPHVRFTVEAGGVRARAVAFGVAAAACRPSRTTAARRDVRPRASTTTGVVEPRLVLRDARPCAPEPVRWSASPPTRSPRRCAFARRARARPRTAVPRAAGRRTPAARRDRARPRLRRHGRRADRRRRARPRRLRRRAAAPAPPGGRLGGFALCAWPALERDPRSPAATTTSSRSTRRPPRRSARSPRRSRRRAGPPRLRRAERAFAAELLEARATRAPGRRALPRAARWHASVRTRSPPSRRTGRRPRAAGAARGRPRRRSTPARARPAPPAAAYGARPLAATYRAARRATPARAAPLLVRAAPAAA